MKLPISICLFVLGAVSQATAVELAVRADVTLDAVDERIYGFLLEHIYHSCDNGVWGEEVFNRSFEDRANYGGFYIAGKKKSGAFEANVTGPDSMIGVCDGSRDGMRTNDAQNTMESPDAVAIRELEFTASSLIIPAFSATVVESVLTL